MKAYHNSVILRNDGTDTATLKKDLNAATSVQVTVRISSTQTLASIFDLDEVATANPLTTDNNGNYAFKANDEIYDIIISEGTANEVKLEKVEIVETPTFPILVNDLSQIYDFETVAEMTSSLIDFPEKKVIRALDRGLFTVVLTSGVTPNGDNIIESTGVPANSYKQRENSEYINTLESENERLHRGENGAIVFIFDDGKRTTFDNGLPVFQAQGEVANMALIADRLIVREPWDGATASLADWKVAQDAGWEAVAHGYYISTVFNSGLDLAVGEEDLQQSFNYFNAVGLKVKQFVAPSSTLDSKFLPKVKEIYSAAHIGSNTSDPAVATPSNGNDAYNLRRVSLEENLTNDALFNTFVDYCKANNTLGVVYAHEVDGVFGSVPLTTARLNSHIDYCQAQGVDILTVSDALQRYNTNTIRGEFLGGESPDDISAFKIKNSNLLTNSGFNVNSTGWVFATGTVGATSRVDGANIAGQFVFEIGAGAGSGTTQISQIVELPTSKVSLPVFGSVFAGAVSGTLDDQDLIVDIIYRRLGAPIANGTKTLTFPLTNVMTEYKLDDFIKFDTVAEEIQLVIKVANNNPGQAVDIAIQKPSLGFDDGAWFANDNKTYVRSRRTTTQAAIPSTGQVVAFATTAVDKLGEYDDAGTFTASRSGILNIDSSVMINDLGFGYDATKLLLDLRKNGAAVLRGSTDIPVGGNRFREPEVAISASIDVVAGDTIDIFFSFNGAASTMIIDPNDNATWLTISG